MRTTSSNSRKGIKIGILSIQGDVEENTSAISSALKIPRGFDDDSVVLVKTPQDVSDLDGLVIPGGESTTIGILSAANGTLDAIKSKIQNDAMPVLGICAGLIMLAKSANDSIVGVMDKKQPLLGVLDVAIQRNAFGRQRQSFETRLSLKPLAISDFKGVFIRAPAISSVGSSVDVLCELNTGVYNTTNNLNNNDYGTRTVSSNKKIIAVRQDNIIGTAFHPELSGDLAIHRYFVEMARQKKRN